MLSEHESYYGSGVDALFAVCSWSTNGLGMDALLTVCFRNTNRTMVWAWMHRMSLKHERNSHCTSRKPSHTPPARPVPRRNMNRAPTTLVPAQDVVADAMQEQGSQQATALVGEVAGDMRSPCEIACEIVLLEGLRWARGTLRACKMNPVQCHVGKAQAMQHEYLQAAGKTQVVPLSCAQDQRWSRGGALSEFQAGGCVLKPGYSWGGPSR